MHNQRDNGPARESAVKRVVLDDVTFQRFVREIRRPPPPTAALVALFKIQP